MSDQRSLSTSQTKIIIDLQGREDVPEIADRSGFIQQDALARLEHLLKDQVADAKARTARLRTQDARYESSLVRDRRHNAIAVFGGRGSGKTTFILNALEELLILPAKKADNGKTDDNILSQVHYLGMIDPTLIEAKGHIFITVLALIKEAVVACYRKRQRNANRDPEIFSDKSFEAVEQKLKSLAEGLNFLQGVGKEGLESESWDDPQFVMERGIHRHHNGSTLENRFHDFIDQSLRYIGAECFALALDDIDTNFQSGWPVLEMLRKYITNPRLIVILSGDSELYSLLIRDHQWKMLKNLYDADVSRQTAIKTGIEQLESQYLDKIIKPSNRIELTPLYSFWESKRQRYDIYIKFSNELTMPLREIVALCAKWTLYSNKNSDVDQTALLILHQPVRKALHLFRAMHQNGMLAGKIQPDDPRIADYHAAFCEVFLSELLSVGLSAHRISSAMREEVLYYMHLFLKDRTRWADGFTFTSNLGSVAPQIGALAISAILARESLSNPGLLFDFLIKFSFVREIILSQDRLHIPEIMNFLGLNRQETSWVTACRALAMIRDRIESNDRVPTKLGTIAVYNVSRKEPKTGTTAGAKFHLEMTEAEACNIIKDYDEFYFNDYVNSYLVKLQNQAIFRRNFDREKGVIRIGYLFTSWQFLNDHIDKRSSFFLKLISVKTNNEWNRTSIILSAIPLIGFLSSAITHNDAFDFMQIFRLGNQIFSNQTAPTSLQSEVEEIEDVADDHNKDDVEDSDESDLVSFALSIQNWRSWAIKILSKSEPLPTFVLSRVWSRFYDALGKVDDEIQLSSKYAGFIVHRQIILFLNSLLIEETIHRTRNRSMKFHLINPIRSDKIFLENLDSSPENYLEFNPTFSVVFACPIWGAYLMKVDDDVHSVHQRHQNSVRPFCTNEENKNIRIETLFQSEYMLGLKKETACTYENLYPLLNSLLVMHRSPSSNAKSGTGSINSSRSSRS